MPRTPRTPHAHRQENLRHEATLRRRIALLERQLVLLRAELNGVENIQDYYNTLPVHVRRIILAVATEHTLSPVDILRRSRHKPFVLARNQAMWELRELGNSFPRIGGWFQRDHSSVQHAVKMHKERTECTKSRLPAPSPTHRPASNASTQPSSSPSN